MEDNNMPSTDFTNAYAILSQRVITNGTANTSKNKPDFVQKQKIQPLPTDSSFALMKLPQVLAHMQVSRSGWLEGVRTGKYPKPVKLSTRRIAWKVSELKAFVDSL
jgi:prophage regulatory protein